MIPQDAIDRIRAKGGVVSGSIRDVGRALGAKSKTTAHRLLHGLASAGLVRLDMSATGCRVALV